MFIPNSMLSLSLSLCFFHSPSKKYFYFQFVFAQNHFELSERHSSGTQRQPPDSFALTFCMLCFGIFYFYRTGEMYLSLLLTLPRSLSHTVSTVSVYSLLSIFLCHSLHLSIYSISLPVCVRYLPGLVDEKQTQVIRTQCHLVFL